MGPQLLTMTLRDIAHSASLRRGDPLDIPAMDLFICGVIADDIGPQVLVNERFEVSTCKLRIVPTAEEILYISSVGVDQARPVAARPNRLRRSVTGQNAVDHQVQQAIEID